MSSSARGAWELIRRGLLEGGGGLGSPLAVRAGLSALIGYSSYVLRFGVQILLARLLGADGFGEYIYVLAWMNLAVLPALLEMDLSAFRFVGQYRGTEDWSRLRGYLRWSHAVVLGAGCCVAVGGMGVVWAFREDIGLSLVPLFVAAAFLLTPTTLVRLEESIVSALERPVEAQVPNYLVRPVLFVLAILLASYGGFLTAANALWLNFLATVAAVAALYSLKKRATPPQVISSTPAYDGRLWRTTSAGLLWVSVANYVLSQQISVLVVGSYLGTTDGGLYAVASQVASLIALAGHAIGYVALPYISEFHEKGEVSRLESLVQWTILVNLVAGLAAWGGLAVLGHTILGWFGEEFEAGTTVLMILAAQNLLIGSFLAVGGFVLTLTGHHNRAGVISVSSAIISLILIVVLTPLFGAAGTAVAGTLGACVKGFLVARAVRSCVGVRIVPTWLQIRRKVPGA